MVEELLPGLPPAEPDEPLLPMLPDELPVLPDELPGAAACWHSGRVSVGLQFEGMVEVEPLEPIELEEPVEPLGLEVPEEPLWARAGIAIKAARAAAVTNVFIPRSFLLYPRMDAKPTPARG